MLDIFLFEYRNMTKINKSHEILVDFFKKSFVSNRNLGDICPHDQRVWIKVK